MLFLREKLFRIVNLSWIEKRTTECTFRKSQFQRGRHWAFRKIKATQEVTHIPHGLSVAQTGLIRQEWGIAFIHTEDALPDLWPARL